MGTFRELLESNYVIDDNFHKFIDALTEYMDFSNKDSINIITKTMKPYITKKNKVYRVMHVDDKINFGRFPLISSSTSKLKGKTLDNVINDMVDRYSYHRGISNTNVKYVTLENVEGIDITSIGNFVIKNAKNFDSYYVDVFKRLKLEKEFLVINNNLKVSNIEEL